MEGGGGSHAAQHRTGPSRASIAARLPSCRTGRTGPDDALLPPPPPGKPAPPTPPPIPTPAPAPHVQALPLDPRRISSIQIMLSKFEYDGQLNPAFRRGQFRLPISSISTYLPPDVPPRFVHVSSAGVTRPNRPGINVDMEPPAVKLNDALGGLLTWKLAGEDALRASGMPYAIVRPTALTDEPGSMPLQLDQGDVIKVRRGGWGWAGRAQRGRTAMAGRRYALCAVVGG